MTRAPLTRSAGTRCILPLSIVLGFLIAPATRLPAQTPAPTVSKVSSKQMPGAKQWTTHNLNLAMAPSYCYGDAAPNCERYGRLYTWESAQQVCRALGKGWRLPSEPEWRELAKHHGGVSVDAADRGHAAYAALLTGGKSGFNALLGGGRDMNGEYARLDAHGFYWTATENCPSTAWFYNFGKGGLALHRQQEGEKERAFSVRCIKE